MTNEPIMIDGVDVSECDFLAKEDDYNSYSGVTYAYKGQCMCSDEEMCKDHPNCFYKKALKQLKRKEQECEAWKSKYYSSTTEVKADLIKQLNQLKGEVHHKTEFIQEQRDIIDQLKAENKELIRYKFLFEKTRNLWNEARMNNYKLLDEIKDLKDSLKRTICQSECYKHKEAEKLKQALQEIKEIANKNEVCPYDISHHCYKYECKRKEHCEIAQILQKCEVIDEK